MCASHWAAKPKGVIKVKVVLVAAEVRSRLLRLGASLSHRIGLPERWRKSVHVGTRKMVNYA
jgi:hypothetical protein